MTNTREENAAEIAQAEARIIARQDIERRIIGRVIQDALRTETLWLSVDDGEPTRNPDELLADCMAVDEARLWFHHARETAPYGSVFFVLGNDGWDVIADYSTSLETYVAEAVMLADQIEEEAGA